MKYFATFCIGMVICLQIQADNHHALTAADRVSLDVAVYHQDFAVLTDHRRATLGDHDRVLEITDVARTIQAETVSLESDRENGFVPQTQSYRYDLLNRTSLLERFVGRKVKYSRFLHEDGSSEKVLREGVLLSIDPEIVMFGDIIEVGPEGTISLPSLPADLTLSPTLQFEGTNGFNGVQDLALRYLASGLSWKSDYTLTLAEKGGKATLEGWVTVRNQSGSDLVVDHLSLIAGEVSKQAPMQLVNRQRAVIDMEMGADAGANVEPVPAGDLHRYEFSGPVSLTKNEFTRLRLIDREGVRVGRTYRKTSIVHQYGMDAGEMASPDIVLSFVNTKKNNLGTPLPAGTVRVFGVSEGREDFVGEASIDHRAEGVKTELVVGKAFDIRVERTQKEFRRTGDRRAEIAYEVVLKNSSDRKAEVVLHEKLHGTWKVLDSSSSAERQDSRTLVFTEVVPAKGEVTVRYRVRLGW